MTAYVAFSWRHAYSEALLVLFKKLTTRGSQRELGGKSAEARKIIYFILYVLGRENVSVTPYIKHKPI